MNYQAVGHFVTHQYIWNAKRLWMFKKQRNTLIKIKKKEDYILIEEEI